MSDTLHTFAVGGLGEFAEWHLVTDVPLHAKVGSPYDLRKPCPHAENIHLEDHFNVWRPNEPWQETHWTVPLAIRIYTQCGYDCTDLCVACLRAAMCDPAFPKEPEAVPV